MSTTKKPAGGDYNVVPYVSKPFPQTQPNRLAALAAMFGLGAPDVTTARVLELGSASGGNMIPLALRFPNARFQCFDLAERHVEDARARIAKLALNNITIEQGDIAALDLKGERFDFIICHGVYSWVPEHVRSAILKICAQHLSPSGIAYVSYNIYPGWRLRRVIRDMMLFHAGHSGEPARRVAAARQILDIIAENAPDSTSYGHLLKAEANSLKPLEDSYILGEFLAEDNAPCYFSEFAEALASHGLTYLCDAELEQCLPETLGTDIAAQIRSLSGDKLIPLEQYMDYFKGRAFRQSLLVGRAHGRGIVRKLSPGAIRKMHVCANGTVAESEGGGLAFTTPAGGTLNAPHPGVRHAFAHLVKVYPSSQSFAELGAAARKAAGRDWPNLDAVITDALFKAATAGIIEVSTVAQTLMTAVPERPRASALAQLDAQEHIGWTTSCKHAVLSLDVVTELLLPYLDGTNGRAELERIVLDAVAHHHLNLIDNQTGAPLAGDALSREAGTHVTLALNRLMEAGLLS